MTSRTNTGSGDGVTRWGDWTGDLVLGNGCVARITLVPKGNLGMPNAPGGLAAGAVTPVADMFVIDEDDIKENPELEGGEGDLAIELKFDIVIKCGRIISECARGCKAKETLKMNCMINIDSLLPDERAKGKLKDCLSETGLFASWTSTCVEAAQNWFKALSLNRGRALRGVGEFLDSHAEGPLAAAKWWFAGTPVGPPETEEGRDLKDSIKKAMGSILTELFNDFKVTQMKRLKELCQCAELPPGGEVSWRDYNQPIITSQLDPKYSGMIAGQIYSDYAFRVSQQGGDV
jgi:hypothetical protein